MSGVATERQPTVGFGGRGTATPCSAHLNPSSLVAYQISHRSQSVEGMTSLPREYPQGDTPQHLLSDANRRLAQTALSESAQRPDPWDVADSVLELGIGICAVLGGVCGTRAIGYLKRAKDKSNALREIVTGNELFKKNNAEAATAFKEAHRNQSLQTRQLVTAIKN